MSWKLSRQNLLIGACLAIVALLAIYAPRSRSQSAPTSFEAASAADLAIRARLDQVLDRQVSFHFRQTPLEQAIEQISHKVGRPIRIHSRCLADASIGSETSVTLDVNDISLRQALGRLLAPLDLTWEVRDEVLSVTTPECAGHDFTLVVYPVRDLALVQSKSTVDFHYGQLVDLITQAIAPTTWDSVGGPGAIHAHSASGALVINQTRELHSQIALLLATLRKARSEQGIAAAEPAKNAAAPRSRTPSDRIPSDGPPSDGAPK